MPRVALDWVPAARMTVGTGFMLLNRGGDSLATDPSEDLDWTGERPTTRTVLVAPRLGYIQPLHRVLALWVRLGFTWAHELEDDHAGSTATTLNLFELSSEVQVSISPFRHWSLQLGPFVDVGLGGNLTEEEEGAASATKWKVKANAFGLSATLSVFGRVY